MSAPAKVYFTDFRTHNYENLTQKFKRLILTAGIDQIDFRGKFVAIKIHFGEMGNLAYLRPSYATALVQVIKDLGGKPFLTDCNTLYVGSRKEALEHMETAYQNGFNPYNTGAHIIIGDGLKGTDDVEVPVAGGEYVRAAKIGRAVMDADIIISLTHGKAHEEAGYGGALKNIGMGCGSRRGKMEMHHEGKPQVDADACVACGTCAKICAHDAPKFDTGKACIDHSVCVGCGRCIANCPVDAIVPTEANSVKVLCAKIAEYTKAVVDGRPNFHIALVCDVSPYCDCYSLNDAPIIPDVGMFASFDPVALDTACGDAVNAMPVAPNSALAERDPSNPDHFTGTHAVTNWRFQVEHAEKIGLGTTNYELIKL